MKVSFLLAGLLLSAFANAHVYCAANQGHRSFQPNCTQAGVDNCESFSNICHLEGQDIPRYLCLANQGKRAFQANCTQAGVNNCESFSNICHLEEVD